MVFNMVGGGGSSVVSTSFDNLSFRSCFLKGNCRINERNEAGVLMSTTFELPANTARVDAFCSMFEEVTIPSYFETFKGGLCTTSTAYTNNMLNLKKVTIESERIEFGTGKWSRSLEEVNFPNATTMTFPSATADLLCHTDADHFKLKMPLMEDFHSALSTIYSLSGTGIVDITGSDFSSAITVWTQTGVGPEKGERLNGTLEFPKCTHIGNISRPRSGNLSIYVPLLERQSDTIFYVATGTGTVHLYIGPNLTTIANASNWANYSSSGALDIHIPNGETTTKTTLTAAGVTAFTQDYDPEV